MLWFLFFITGEIMFGVAGYIVAGDKGGLVGTLIAGGLYMIIQSTIWRDGK